MSSTRWSAAKGFPDDARYPQVCGALPGAFIQLAREQDRRYPNSFFLQTVHYVEAVYIGHVLVDHQTARGAMATVGKELAAGGIRQHIEPEGFEQDFQGIDDPCVVIYDADPILDVLRRRALPRNGHGDLFLGNADQIRNLPDAH